MQNAVARAWRGFDPVWAWEQFKSTAYVYRHVIAGLLAWGYFASLAAPDLTYINRNTDSIDYLSGAKWLRLTHPTGGPVYNLVNHFLLLVPHPFTNDYAWLALFTALSGAALVYMAYRMTDKLLPPLLVMGSSLIVSQSTVVNAYVPIVFLIVLMWWLHVKDRRTLKYCVGAIGLGIHHLIALAIIPILLIDLYRARNEVIPHVWQAVILLLGFLPYIYIPVFNTPPYIWTQGQTLQDYFKYCCNQGGLIGGLAVYPVDNLVERLRNTSWIVLGNFGLALPIVAAGLYWAVRQRQRLVLGLFVGAWGYYFIDLDPQTFVYVMPGFIFAGVMVAQLPQNALTRYLYRAGVIGMLALVAWNAGHYAIGRNLDPAPTSARYLYTQIAALPPGAMIWSDNQINEYSVPEYYSYLTPNKPVRNVRCIIDDVACYQQALDAHHAGRLYVYALADSQTRRINVVRWDMPDEWIVRSMVYDSTRTPSVRIDILTGRTTVIEDNYAKSEAIIAKIMAGVR